MSPHRSISRFFRSGCAVLLLLAVMATGCDETTMSAGSTRWIIRPGTMSLAILVSDYSSGTFERGTIDYYPACDGCDDDTLPVTIRYNPPGDFGDITFEYSATGDTLFHGTIIWMGTGGMEYPREFIPADEFESLPDTPPAPLSIEYFNIAPAFEEETFKQQATLAWNRVRNLDIVNEFAQGEYRVGIYLYAPAVGLFNPEAAKWIIFLHAQKRIPLLQR